MKNRAQVKGYGVLAVILVAIALVFWPRSSPSSVQTPSEKWSRVADFSGGYGNYTSATFVTHTSDWRISWTEVRPSGWFGVWVHKEGEGGSLPDYCESVFCVGGGNFDPVKTPESVHEYQVHYGNYVLVHAAPGRYYLYLACPDESWELTVEEKY